MDNSDKVGLNDEQTRFFDVYDGVVVRTQAPQRERILRPRRRFLRRRMDIGGCDSLLASWAFCASCVRMIPRISSFAATTSSTTGLLSSLFFATFAPSTPSSSDSAESRGDVAGCSRADLHGFCVSSLLGDAVFTFWCNGLFLDSNIWPRQDL